MPVWVPFRVYRFLERLLGIWQVRKGRQESKRSTSSKPTSGQRHRSTVRANFRIALTRDALQVGKAPHSDSAVCSQNGRRLVRAAPVSGLLGTPLRPYGCTFARARLCCGHEPPGTSRHCAEYQPLIRRHARHRSPRHQSAVLRTGTGSSTSQRTDGLYSGPASACEPRREISWDRDASCRTDPYSRRAVRFRDSPYT